MIRPTKFLTFLTALTTMRFLYALICLNFSIASPIRAQGNINIDIFPASQPDKQEVDEVKEAETVIIPKEVLYDMIDMDDIDGSLEIILSLDSYADRFLLELIWWESTDQRVPAACLFMVYRGLKDMQNENWMRQKIKQFETRFQKEEGQKRRAELGYVLSNYKQLEEKFKLFLDSTK